MLEESLLRAACRLDEVVRQVVKGQTTYDEARSSALAIAAEPQAPALLADLRLHGAAARRRLTASRNPVLYVRTRGPCALRQLVQTPALRLPSPRVSAVAPRINLDCRGQRWLPASSEPQGSTFMSLLYPFAYEFAREGEDDA